MISNVSIKDKMEVIPMATERGSRNGVTKALIKSKWFEVLQINTTTRKAIVLDSDGKERLVDLTEITNLLTGFQKCSEVRRFFFEQQVELFSTENEWAVNKKNNVIIIIKSLFII